jgi:hypothetical protein
MSTQIDLSARLDEDFLFILKFLKQHLASISTDQYKSAQKWLYKLCFGDYETVEAKRNRNQYLNKLLASLDSGSLANVFLTPPPIGDLPLWETADESKIELKDFFKDVMKEEEQAVHVGGKDFETYVSTKLLENDQGACAYLAVSVVNEGDPYPWVQLSNNQKIKEIALAKRFDEYQKHLR